MHCNMNVNSTNHHNTCLFCRWEITLDSRKRKMTVHLKKKKTMHDDQKDQVLLCANKSIEVALRLNTAAVCGFLKTRQLEKTTHNNCS